jgi:molybdopterin molybdotransferase
MQAIDWPSNAFHLPDNKEEIKTELQTLLEENDVLILSGGVSKGKFDFIPKALEELGIQKLFHQVNQRPGKPFWFGTSGDKSKVVFALPGNPVSTFLCFHKYIKPWVLKNLGVEEKPVDAILTSNLTFSPALTYFLQVRTQIQEGRILAHPVPGGGSGDFVNLKGVDGFLELPANKSTFSAGEVFPFISFR